MNNLYEEMNTFLADLTTLSVKVHNIHWNLKGDDFYTIHKLMDEFYEDLNEKIDAVAERLIVIGGRPIGSLKKVLAQTTLKELDDHNLNSSEGFNHLIVDYNQLLQHANRLIKLADEENDYGTADDFTDFSKDFGKTLWMLNSYIA